MFESKKIIDRCMHYGLSITQEKAEWLSAYCNMLWEANKSINLTRNIDEDDMIEKNIIDCMFAASKIKNSSKVIDIGSGPGLPGIVINIMTSSRVIMLDSIGKKIDFINSVCYKLGLNAKAIKARAEEYGQKQEYRECFDYAVTRAVAPLNVILEYCVPFIERGGIFIAMKGSNYTDELETAKNAIAILNCKLIDNNDYILEEDSKRHLLIFEKMSETEKTYPRQTKSIVKKPL